MSFFEHDDFIKEGDPVVIYADNDNIVSVIVKNGLTVNMKNGALRHEFLIGKRFGTRLSATAGSVYALRPYPALWTKVLKRHTQILYTPESSMIVNLLDLKPGDIVCESGTGSGSLTHFLAMAVGPTGRVYTHDVELLQYEKIQKEIVNNGLIDVVFPVLRDVCKDGFEIEAGCNAVFLDLPAPFSAVTNVIRAFNRNYSSQLVSFSPCIEQTQELFKALSSHGFINIRTIELIGSTYKVSSIKIQTTDELLSKREIKQYEKTDDFSNELQEDNSSSIDDLITYPDRQPTHAGYLTYATLLPLYKF